ncbi:MAG: NAD(P)H-dependent oxidoreductase subunit E [Actinomycetota bacterium]|nr:NAD(P)H-dependent oxidoreductase subunit E [Actinomycetota bacterium]MDK1016845.1 NAD(P)H-dependent oxidoreductase subunit E [Actinomycetota bacterium]MDK1038319.1 NAD(P)H-dependent oxidoreductase subunit E [Actinomycetota bacterium]MDK1097048.1 NAD(P)H-dependent oxidoreductase subunit E [Actinomycetota bacterium]MDK1102989.1 NAD(P)H-dependent oxidoreductase subunit E [Actinomycetota bacterium]
MTAVISNWSHDNQERAKRIIASYPEKRSALMPLLYIASLEHAYVSDDAMREVAELTGITPVQVQSVASFYTMFKRGGVGDYLVSVCTSISCYLGGADDVLAAVESSIGDVAGEAAAERPITVEHVECIGACGGAPAVQVNYELIEGVTPEKAVALIKWLTATRPEVILTDEMQQLFGGRRSFEWGSTDSEGAVRPIPAFGPYGSVGGGSVGGGSAGR